MDKRRLLSVLGFIASSLLSLATAHGASTLLKPLRDPNDGTRYPPVCGAKEIKNLREEIFKFVPDQKPQEAFDLAKAMLCGDTKKEEEFVLGRMTNPIVRKSESTGEVGVSTESVAPSAALLVRRQAWVRGELASAEGEGQIRVAYASNEACIASFLLKLKDGQWKIVEMGEGCD